MKSVSDTIKNASLGMQVLALSEEQALALIQKATPEEIAQAMKLKQQQMKEGTTITEALKTAGIAKDLLMALMLLAPAAMASPSGMAELQMKLKAPQSIEMQQIQQVEQGQARNLAEKTNAQVADIKKMIAEAKEKPGKPVTGAPVTIAGKKYTADTDVKSGILKKIVSLYNDLRGAGTDEAKANKTVQDLLASARIVPM